MSSIAGFPDWNVGASREVRSRSKLTINNKDTVERSTGIHWCCFGDEIRSNFEMVGPILNEGRLANKVHQIGTKDCGALSAELVKVSACEAAVDHGEIEIMR